MTEAQIHAQLMQQFPGMIGPLQPISPEEHHIRVAPQALHKICEFMLRSPQLRFDFLRNITMYPGSDRLTALYHLYSFEHGHAISLRIDVPKSQTQFNTVTDLWPAADRIENETQLRLGIQFETAVA